jgi:hypothetical protein
MKSNRYIHGGGWLAHFMSSDVVLLSAWAHLTQLPIVSINYSLGSEAKFPTALREVVVAYVKFLGIFCCFVRACLGVSKYMHVSVSLYLFLELGERLLQTSFYFVSFALCAFIGLYFFSTNNPGTASCWTADWVLSPPRLLWWATRLAAIWPRPCASNAKQRICPVRLT